MNSKTRTRAFFLTMILFNLAANFAHPVTPTIIKDLGLHDYMFGLSLAVRMTVNFLISRCCSAASAMASPSFSSAMPPQKAEFCWRGRWQAYSWAVSLSAS